MYERFTDRARKAIQLALRLAQESRSDHITPEHLFLALVRAGGVAVVAIESLLEVTLGTVQEEFRKLLPLTPTANVKGMLPKTQESKSAIGYAIEEARLCGHSYVGTEHLLLGLLRIPSITQTAGKYGLVLDRVREEVLRILGPEVHHIAEIGELIDGVRNALSAVARKIQAVDEERRQAESMQDEEALLSLDAERSELVNGTLAILNEWSDHFRN